VPALHDNDVTVRFVGFITKVHDGWRCWSI